MQRLNVFFSDCGKKIPLVVYNVSSVYKEDQKPYWHAHYALSEVSNNGQNFWHSAEGDYNPFIQVRMNSSEAKEIIWVEVTDRQDCCLDRFKNVEVFISGEPSGELISCGVQSYAGETMYRYYCPKGYMSQYVLIQKHGSDMLHVNHVSVQVIDCEGMYICTRD